MDNSEIRYSDIEPLCLLRAVLKNIWMVFAAGLCGLFGAYLVLDTFYAPEYCGSATFVVMAKSSSSSSVSDISTANTVASTFSELLSGSIMQQKVADMAGIDDFSGAITAENKENTNLVALKVTAPTAKQAFAMISALAENHTVLTGKIFNNAVITTLNSPTVTEVPAFTGSRFKTEIISAIVCAAVMAAALCAFSVYSDTVQTESAARAKIDGKLLRSVPHGKSWHTAKGAAKKLIRSAGKKRSEAPVITDPMAGFAFTESVHYIRSKIEQKKAESGKNVFLIGSVCQNEGKSMLIENLGLSLGMKHDKIVIADMDLRKPSPYCGASERDGWELLKSFNIGGILLNMIYHPKKNLHVLYCPEQPKIPADLFSKEGFITVLKSLRESSNYLLIDSPPLEIFSDGEVLADFADYSILVVRQDCVPAPVINDAIDVLRTKNAVFMGFVFNDVKTLRKNSGYGYGYGYGGKYGYGKKYGYGYGYDRYGSYGKYGYGNYGYKKYAEAAAEEQKKEE